MPAAVNARLRQDTIEFVQSPAYLPVSIPKLRTVPVWFQETADEGGPSSAIALVRNEYKQKGLGVLQIIVFLLVLPSLGGKPLPYSQSVQNVAKHHDVLKAVVERIDERLVKQVPRVDGGLAMFIALQWEECECDTAFARQWLDPILRPIIEFAGKSYLRLDPLPAITEPSTTTRLQGKKPPPVSSDLRFLINLSNVWTDPKPLELDSNSSLDSSAADISDESGRPPAKTVPTPAPIASQVFFPEEDPETFMDPAVGFSPTSFSPIAPSIKHGEVLTEDLHRISIHDKKFDVFKTPSPLPQPLGTPAYMKKITPSAFKASSLWATVEDGPVLYDLSRTTSDQYVACGLAPAFDEYPGGHGQLSATSSTGIASTSRRPLTQNGTNSKVAAGRSPGKASLEDYSFECLAFS